MAPSATAQPKSMTDPASYSGYDEKSATQYLDNDAKTSNPSISSQGHRLDKETNGTFNSFHASSEQSAVADQGRQQQQGDIAALEKPVHNVNDISSIPNGGRTAWLQVAGAFALLLNTWGIVNTFGVYQTYYTLSVIPETPPSTVAWIGSVQACLLLFVGLLSGPVYDMGYFRALLLVGSFLVVFGHMMLSICTMYWQIILAQSLCIGVGMGCLFVPSVAILSTYFSTRIALATGLAASGSSLGGVIYPIVLHRLLPRIGFPWAVRVLGFISLGTLVLPVLVMKVRVLPAGRRKMIDMSAFRNAPFMLFCIGLFIGFCGLYMPLYFVESFAIKRNITSEDFAFYLLSLLNAMSIFGRIIPNVIADKIGPMNVITPCAIMTGVLTFCLIAVHNLAGVVVIVLLFGFFSGCLVSLPAPVVFSLTTDRRTTGTRLGMAFGFLAIGTLLGAPIGGVLIHKFGFAAGWIYGGALSVSGGIIIAIARIAHKGWNPGVKA